MSEYIIPNDLDCQDLVSYRDAKDNNCYYKLIRIRNANFSRTLYNSRLIFLKMYAGKRYKPDALRYQFITKDQAIQLYQKQDNYEYSIEDFQPFKLSKKAKLLSPRTSLNKSSATDLGSFYAIDQEIKLGDIPPMTDIYLVAKSLGSSKPEYNVRIMGDTRYEDEDDEQQERKYTIKRIDS